MIIILHNYNANVDFKAASDSTNEDFFDFFLNDGVLFCDFQLHIIITNISASLWAEPADIF